MTGFDPSRFAAQMQAQMQGLSFGLQNMGANIQRTVADSIRRAQESGNFIDTSDLQPGEFRRFTDRDGNPTGFAFRYTLLLAFESWHEKSGLQDPFATEKIKICQRGVRLRYY